MAAGFNTIATLFHSNIQPQFSDSEIALVLSYHWPDQFGDLKAKDVANVAGNVRGAGKHEDSDDNSLDLDDPTLSDYIHGKIYREPQKGLKFWRR